MKNLFNKKELNLKKISLKAFNFWVSHRVIFFILILLAVFGLGLYFSYKNLYKDPWNEEKRNQYISTQRKEINFQEENFKQAVEEIEEKEKNYQGDFYPINDIFSPLEK